MGKTSISWTDFSFNPWIGCTKVSEGCKHCYAESLVKRLPQLVRPTGQGILPVWGEQAPRRRTSEANWKEPLKWNRDAQKAGKRARVFCASLADVFEDRPELAPWRCELFGLIAATPYLDWLLLTKRPENVMQQFLGAMQQVFGVQDTAALKHLLGRAALPDNVWLGCTVENQEQAERRLPHLLGVSARIHFVSYEPALELVNFGPWLPGIQAAAGALALGIYPKGTAKPGIDWIIVGGESGSTRPFEISWARSAIDQCRAAMVPVFVKQLGARPLAHTIDGLKPLHFVDKKGGDPEEWPEYLRVREFPK